MKHILTKDKKRTVIYLVAGVVIMAAGVFLAHDWLTSNYYRMQAEKTIRTEIKPLQNVLGAMGYSNLDDLNTVCEFTTTQITTDNFDPKLNTNNSKSLDCSSGVNRYVKLPTDKTTMQQYESNVSKLSNLLATNGWESRKDYPTKQWFHNILAGIDYQPDQYNQKHTGNFTCMIDFFTSFSKQYKDSQQPAVTLTMHCSKSDDPLPII